MQKISFDKEIHYSNKKYFKLNTDNIYLNGHTGGYRLTESTPSPSHVTESLVSGFFSLIPNVLRKYRFE